MKRIIAVTAVFLAYAGAAFAAQDDEANKKILRDAVQGAITGAVASEATKDEETARVSAPPAPPAPAEAKEVRKAKKSKKGKKFDRPPGWDKGKKTGWGDSDRPPGWDKGEKTGWDDADVPPGLAKKGKHGR